MQAGGANGDSVLCPGYSSLLPAHQNYSGSGRGRLHRRLILADVPVVITM